MISIQKFKGLANVILNARLPDGQAVKNLFLPDVSVCRRQLVTHSKLYNLLKALLPAYCLLLCCLLSNAQIYPVQVTPQMVPPYSFKLSDYTTTTQEKLFVNLLLTDAQESGRQVRLQLFVEGPGINFQSVDFVSGAVPIVLDGGINQRLTNLDLQPYFNLNNLVGITPRQYSQQLPEGQYRFCFEVYDQFSGQRISNRSCANIFLILNDPPILNVPGRGDLIMAQNPQNIIFNWTPRHINAGAVQYEFTLKELWDTGMDPQAAFLASPPLYQITTFANTLHYGPAQMQLLEGKTYGWQVRAFISDGISDTSLFRNNGLSEIFHFTYQADCPPPHFVLSEAQNSQTVNITWQMGEHLRYRVQYRKKGYGDNDWFGLWSQGNEATLRNLEAGTVYEFRVGGDCTAPLSVSPGGGEGSGVGLAFSPIHEFTTPTEDEMAYYNCGIPPEIEITNQDPLQNLGVNEVFTAGDFPVVVREASGSNGYFSGWGYITLPFLESLKEVIDVANIATGGEVNVGKFTRIRVEFDNIKINTDYQLVEGMVETSYDPNWSGIVDVGEAIGDIGNLLKLLSDELNSIVATLKENWELNRQVDAAIEILETNLDDPNNGLTDEQEENIRNFISDRDRVKQTIIEEKEKIADGERDDVIKQNLASNLIGSEEDHLTRCTLEKLLDVNTISRDKVFDITSNGDVFIIVQDNFQSWLEESQNVTTSNTEINAVQDWSIRADAQFSKRHGRILFDRLFETIRNAPKNELYSLHSGLYEKGVYLGTYEMNETIHGLALYTPKAIPQVFKLEAEDYCELVSSEQYNDHIKVMEIANSLVLAFLNENQEVTFMVQLMSNNDADFESILKWFGVLKLYKPNILVRDLTQQQILNELYLHEELRAVDIGAYRVMIANLPEEDRAEAYLELQRHVPYRSQLDNECKIVSGSRMCNVTSLAMNFEALGISNPTENEQFEDWLAVEAGGAPEIYYAENWISLGNSLNIEGSSVSLETSDKSVLEELIKPELEKGNSISLSLYPYPKGHIVRVQGIDEQGLWIDDPNGHCPLTCMLDRESGETGYDKGTRNTQNPTAGNNNLYTWEEIAQITVKYMVVFSNQ